MRPMPGDSTAKCRCRGEREPGDVPHLVAPVVEASEDLREREESNLGQLLASHEIRKVCSAIAVVRENLVRGGTLRGNKDFGAPGALVYTRHRWGRRSACRFTRKPFTRKP